MAFSAFAQADTINNNVPNVVKPLKPIKKNLLHGFHPMRPPGFGMPGFGPPRNMPPNGAQPNNSQFNSVPPVDAQPTNALPGTPYGSIVTRNVFGLNPIPPPAPPDQQDQNPPPKITLTGITTIFGPAEALYKVAGGNRDGKQWQDQSYILTEGESQDEVEVTHIDVAKGMVSFINHGVAQDVLLAVGEASGGDSGPGPGSGSPQNRFSRFGIIRRPGFGGPQSFQQSNGSSYNSGYNNGNNFNPANQNNNGVAGQYNYNGSNPNGSSGQPALSGDDEMALIAAQHAEMAQQGNPAAAIFPPTPYDNEANQAASQDSGSSQSGGTTTAMSPSGRGFHHIGSAPPP